MKHLQSILLLASCSLLVTCSSPLPTKAMTFNIRYNNPNDGDNWWEERKGEVVGLIQRYDPDFLGLQEALTQQMGYISQQLPDYNYIGHARDGIGTNSESAPIFYKPAQYELVTKQTMWLSETPDKVSIGWDAALNRIVTYGLFRDKETHQFIHIFNAHYDHMGTLARQKSSELIVDYINNNNLTDEKIVLMGDFNSLPSEAPVEILKTTFEDSFNTQGVPVDGTVGTFNAFDTTATATKRIDYIFTRNADVQSYRCIDDRRENGLHVSDHFALIVEMR